MDSTQATLKPVRRFHMPMLCPKNLEEVARIAAEDRDRELADAEERAERALARAKTIYDATVAEILNRKAEARTRAFERCENLQAGCEPGAHERFMAAVAACRSRIPA